MASSLWGIMANPEHLKILKQGVEVWNRWRKENPEVRPDLKEACLDGCRLARANLRGANLHRAILAGARLDHANLISADLDGAHLSNARLGGANLTDASLMHANLDGSHLAGANLHGTYLHGAYLVGTELAGTHFDGAIFGWTAIADADLSRSYGLEAVDHDGPSNIATSTLERTAARLVKDASRKSEIEAFLQGAGVSEDYLRIFRLSIEEPPEVYSCFISYSHSDKDFARRLHDQLQARGVRCWLDEHDLKPGDRILDVVNDAIRLHDKILLCCSEASLNSWWVKDEIRKAQERERKEGRLIIIPLNLDGYLFEWEDGLASDLTSRLAADFTGWEHDNAKFEEQFERVVRALRTDQGAGAGGGGVEPVAEEAPYS